jgi:hypothetical protein
VAQVGLLAAITSSAPAAAATAAMVSVKFRTDYCRKATTNACSKILSNPCFRTCRPQRLSLELQLLRPSMPGKL